MPALVSAVSQLPPETVANNVAFTTPKKPRISPRTPVARSQERTTIG
jgi:hypothetical protein